MAEPKLAQKGPFLVNVEAGKTYWWCACGQSRKQPFCDSSHKGGPFSPIEYKAMTAAKLAFCGCKRTGGKPLCDGTHSRLP
jgi:CDGSH-type Zn-finger protein